MTATEDEVSERMFKFLQNFYIRYPHFMKTPLFITGESYGGHYVPAVGARVLRGQGDGVGVLKAISVGNGEVDPKRQWASKPVMAFTGGGGSLGHGVVNTSTFLAMATSLGSCENLASRCATHPDDAECLMTMTNCSLDLVMPVMASGLNPYDLRKTCAATKPGEAVGMNCYNHDTEEAFLNDNATKRKLGVPLERAWTACNLNATMPFITSGDEFRNYEGSVKELLVGGVQVLVYAGDTDFMVDWVGCRDWVANLPWEHQEDWAQAPNKPILLDGEMAGFQQTAHGLTFVQVFGAGHMVPMDQPKFTLEMMRRLFESPTDLQMASPFSFSEWTPIAEGAQHFNFGSGVFVGVAVSLLVFGQWPMIKKVRRGAVPASDATAPYHLLA